MTDYAHLTIKMPHVRLFVAKIIFTVAAQFVPSEATGQRIGDAVMAWVQRGFRVYANGVRV